MQEFIPVHGFSQSSQIDVSLHEDAEGTAVSRLMQIPQYVVITAGEVMFSVTGLGFAYSQVCSTDIIQYLSTVQYNTIQCSAKQYNGMQCNATQRNATQHYTILYYTILYYTILYYTILYYTILY